MKTTLAQAIANIPLGFYIRFGAEMSEDEQKPVLCAVLFEERSGQADRVLVGVSAETAGDLEHLTIAMITQRWLVVR